MERCVRVGATHGFLVGRDDVVMVIAVPVVPHGGAAGDLLDHFQGNMLALLVLRRGGNGKIEAAQRLAQIAAGTLGKVRAGVWVHCDRDALRCRELFQCVVQALLHIRRRQ